jgi:hypothetical protein
MISVQNLRQLLNGNNILFLSILFLLSFTSCTISKISGNDHAKVYMPDENNKITQIVDTVRPDTLIWIEDTKVMENDTQNINDIQNYKTEIPTEKYKIDVLIPMDSYTVAGSLEDIEQSSTNVMLHYYGGMIMALVDMKEKGANFTVNVYDAPVEQDRVNDYLETAEKNKPDIIIGPNEKEQLKKVNEFGRKYGIPVVAPWRAIPNCSNNNSDYIQLKPGLDSYYELMITDIDEKFSPEDVFIVGSDDSQSKNRIKNILEMHKVNSSGSKDYNQMIVPFIKLESDKPVFSAFFNSPSKSKAIILPNWSVKDEDFLFTCLRKLNIEKSTNELVVYGMPILLNSEKISYDIFKRLNVRIVSPNFLDETDIMVREFKLNFYKQFNVFPEPEAYEGYDMMAFIGSNMLEYGSKFYKEIENKEIDLLTTGYSLSKQKTENSENPVNDSESMFFENKKLFIIGFENNSFIKIK